jgi:hypothetical protein
VSEDFVGLEMSLRWWVMPYLMILYWFAMLIGTKPKDEHVEWIIARGARWVRTFECDVGEP